MDQIKSYFGWNYGADCFSTLKYDFIKNIGILRKEVKFNCDPSTIIERINLIGSIIDVDSSGITW